MTSHDNPRKHMARCYRIALDSDRDNNIVYCIYNIYKKYKK